MGGGRRLEVLQARAGGSLKRRLFKQNLVPSQDSAIVLISVVVIHNLFMIELVAIDASSPAAVPALFGLWCGLGLALCGLQLL